MKKQKVSKANKSTLEENKALFRNTFYYSDVGMALLDLECNFIKANPAVYSLIGYSQKELKHKNLKEIIANQDLNKFNSVLSQIMALGNSPPQEEIHIKHKRGYLRAVSLKFSLIHTKSSLPYFLMHIQDSIEQELAKEKIEYLATHNHLTGLLNRHSLQTNIDSKISATNAAFAVLFISLDRLYLIHEIYGHDLEEKLIKSVSERLQSLLGKNDIAGYFGGDEFVIVSHEYHNENEAIKLIEKIRNLLGTPIVIGVHEFTLTVSIGVSLYSADGNNAEILLKKASIAMFHCKKQGNCFACYHPELFGKPDTLKIEAELRKAIAKNELKVHYQPQVSGRSKMVIGLEALVRWHQDHKIILPSEFIPIAEETDLINLIGEQVLQESCTYFKFLQKKHHINNDVKICINLSPHQFRNKNLIDMIANTLSDNKINPANIELEITENTFMDNIENNINLINDFCELGLNIAIDDFGTGYSSLSYLKHFNTHRIKIDKSFVQTSLTDKNSQSIILSIIALANSLKIKVTAEGIETEDQYLFLLKNNCFDFQGYYFSKALNEKDLLLYLSKNR